MKDKKEMKDKKDMKYKKDKKDKRQKNIKNQVATTENFISSFISNSSTIRVVLGSIICSRKIVEIKQLKNNCLNVVFVIVIVVLNMLKNFVN